MPAAPAKKKILLNIDLSAIVAGFESAKRLTAAHHEIAEHYASPLLLGPPLTDLLRELVTHMFTEEEAELVRHLKPLRPKDAAWVATRAGRPVDEVTRVLDHVALKKAIILAYGQPRKYTLLPIVPGTFEMALMTPDLSTRNSWHQKFAALFERLWESDYFADYPGKSKIAAVRYLPVGGVADSLFAAWPSDRLEEVLAPYKRFAVGHCQCRLAMHLTNQGCHRETENCMAFGPSAKNVVARGLMREISREEVIERKRAAEREGSVTFVMNEINPKIGNGSCSCCGCCCHALRAIKRLSMPGMASRPHFMPRHNNAACKMCKKCVTICPMEAWTATDTRLEFNSGRCIGCGLCVTACNFKALSLEPVASARPPLDSKWEYLANALPTYLGTSTKVWLKRLLAARD